jgi:hypothetical protein
MLPLLPGNMIIGFGIVGQPPPNDPRDFPRASTRIVSAGYAEAIGLRLVAGRLFGPHDDAGTPPVVMVASRWHGIWVALTRPRRAAADARTAAHEVVGVGDVRHTGLDAERSRKLRARGSPLRTRVSAVGPDGAGRPRQRPARRAVPGA